MKTHCLTIICLFISISQKSVAQFTTSMAPVQITEKDTKVVVQELAEVMAKGYVSTEKGIAIKTLLLKNLKTKKYKVYKTCNALIAELIKDTQSIINDKHFNILYFPPNQAGFSWSNEGEEETPEVKQMEELRNFDMHRRLNFGLPKLEVLEGNIGYLRVSWFNSPNKWFERPLSEAFNFLKSTDALILDVRNNPGGLEETVNSLVSYFFDQDGEVLLTTSYQRLENKEYPYYTNPNPIGSKYLNRKVYVLTSSSTGSGGEMFTYHMKYFNKGIIIGETTSGAANGFNTMKIGDDRLGNIMVLVPDTYTEHAITKSNWEKVGIEPDISVKAEDALFTAYKEALSYLELNTEDLDLKKVYQQLHSTAEYKIKPIPAKINFNQDEYTGKYDIRTITRDGELLFYQRENGPKVRMQNVGEDIFELDVITTPKPIVRFKRKEGKIKSFIVSSTMGEVEATKNNK